MAIRIQPMTETSARQMLQWRYEPPYDQYDADVDEDAFEDEIAYLTDDANHFYAIYDENDLIGHCVFKHEAQVNGGDYSAEALDIGIGMRPFWIGSGKGTSLTKQIIDFAQQRYSPPRYRATIAAWNERAQQVCLNNGFEIQDRFTRDADDSEWVILVKEANDNTEKPA